jgi:membrane fusion protein, multidrug efflux system
MQRRLVLLTLAAVCAAAASFYWLGDAGRLEPALASLRDGDANVGKQPVDTAGLVSVVAATASTADFPILRYAIGSISSPAVVEVSPRISSQIVSIAVKDGQMVKAGDLLFTLDDRALKAQVERDKATLAKDQAVLDEAGVDLNRAKDLAEKKAGTQQAYDLAQTNEKSAQATIAGDQAQLDQDLVQLSYATITAPISGRLGAVSVAVGDVVSASTGSNTATPLVTITEIDPLRVSFNLPESDLPLLQEALASPRPGAVSLHLDGDPRPIGQGTLDFLDSSVDASSGTITARASVPNPELTLWPGQYVDVVLDAGAMPHMTSIPTVAVQSGQKGPFVYDIRPNNTVEVRQIKVGLTAGDRTAVSEGLKSGERIVVEGQTRLSNGTRVREAAAGSTTSAANATPDGQPGGKN